MKGTKGFHKFILLWFGELISSIGSGLTSFGLGVYVFQRTGSVSSTVMITLLAFLPTLLLSVPAGIFADRMDRRCLMMIGDGCSAIGLIYILLCMLDGDAALWQIYLGVTVSSIFSSLLEPSYRATISDLLTKEEYAKASGLIGLAGSARYLIAPFLAGILLAVADIRLLLIIDISTFILTIISTGIVRNGMTSQTRIGDNHGQEPEEILPKRSEKNSFMQDLQEGWNAINKKKGVMLLVIMASFMTLSMGTIQVLSEPMILAFADSTTLGIAESICACGMLISSIVLGMKGIKRGYVRKLSVSLMLAGGAMLVFGIRENIILICVAGFMFFCMLPISNCCLDYLVRVNIKDELQGRVWGLIGFLSQIGYVVAYAIVGVGADAIADGMSVSAGRGCGYMVMVFGGLLVVLAVITYRLRSIRALEDDRI